MPSDVEENLLFLKGVRLFHGRLLLLERCTLFLQLSPHLVNLYRGVRLKLDSCLLCLGYGACLFLGELLAFFLHFLAGFFYPRVHSVEPAVTQRLFLTSGRTVLLVRAVTAGSLRWHGALITIARGADNEAGERLGSGCGGKYAARWFVQLWANASSSL